MTRMIDVRPGKLSTLTLRRKEKAHAYTREMLIAIDDAITELTPLAQAVVIQSDGSGPFCGGADLEQLRSGGPDEAQNLRSQAVFTRLQNAPFLTIAAIHGPAVGGGVELALACDLRVASSQAWFQFPETRLGILPAAGGTTRLARQIGLGHAKAMILTGERVSAESALGWGLIHRIESDPQSFALQWAKEIIAHFPHLISAQKQILSAFDETQSLAHERTCQAKLYAKFKA